MKRFGGYFMHLGVAGMLVAGAICSHAQTTPQPNLDKHARKIHHRLERYDNGRYLHLVLRDSSSAYGALGALSDASFTFTNADSNSISTYRYEDVAKVKTDKEPIGEGTEPRHRIRHLIPIAAGVALAGAGAAAYQTMR